MSKLVTAYWDGEYRTYPVKAWASITGKSFSTIYRALKLVESGERDWTEEMVVGAEKVIYTVKKSCKVR